MQIAGYRTEKATAAQAEQLASIRVAAMRPSLEAVGRFDPERARERFLKSYCPGETEIIYANEKIVGFYVLRRRSDHLYLDHLYVRGLMPEGAESYAKPFSATCIRQ